jgi:hypothetical protein
VSLQGDRKRYWALLPLLDTIAASTERFRARIAALG